MERIKKAIEVIRHDGLVIYPTDTIYGLGADALSDEAIDKVYSAKQRPVSLPISIAVSDAEMARCFAEFDEVADLFFQEFLPGPFTPILKAKKLVPDILTGGTGMIGIRIPSHPIPVAIITALDTPITATSANQHGSKEPTLPHECNVPHDYLIDDGILPGVPSTVVSLIKRQIVRKGVDYIRVEEFLKKYAL